MTLEKSTMPKKANKLLFYYIEVTSHSIQGNFMTFRYMTESHRTQRVERYYPEVPTTR